MSNPLTYSVNNSYANGTSSSVMLYAFKTFMVSSGGYTVTASGDGVSNFSMSSDVITSSGTGAHGMTNTGSWFILKEKYAFAGQQRQWLFWFYTTSYATIIYSYMGFSTNSSEGHNNSAVSATNPPIAYDEITPYDNTIVNTPASMVQAVNSYYPALPYPSGLTWYAHFAVGNNSSGPNPWFILFTSGGGTPGIYGLVAYDQMATGSYDSANPDPTSFMSVYVAGGTVWSSYTGIARYNAKTSGSRANSLVDPTIFPQKTYFATLASMGSITQGFVSGNDFAMPAQIYSYPTNPGRSVVGANYGSSYLLGTSNLFIHNVPSRAFPNIINYNSLSYLAIGNLSLLWNGSTPPST